MNSWTAESSFILPTTILHRHGTSLVCLWSIGVCHHQATLLFRPCTTTITSQCCMAVSFDTCTAVARFWGDSPKFTSSFTNLVCSLQSISRRGVQWQSTLLGLPWVSFSRYAVCVDGYVHTYFLVPFLAAWLTYLVNSPNVLPFNAYCWREHF